MRLRALLIALSLMPPTTCIGQVSFDQARVPMVELGGPWRSNSPGADIGIIRGFRIRPRFDVVL
jgi:hypothetical protein